MSVREPTTVPSPSVVISDETEAFWAGLVDGVVRVQRCRDCGASQLYPGTLCRSCWSERLDWAAASGAATVHAYTVAHVPGHPHWTGRTPYVIATVALEEGPRLTSNIVGCDVGDVDVGLAVRAETVPDASGRVLLYFRPAEPG